MTFAFQNSFKIWVIHISHAWGNYGRYKKYASSLRRGRKLGWPFDKQCKCNKDTWK